MSVKLAWLIGFPVVGLHQGQRTFAPRRQAGHMTAADHIVRKVNKSACQGGPSTLVVHGGRGQHAGDGDLAAGDVEMQLVADPCLLIALAVLLAADVAGGGQLGESFCKALRGLPFEARRLRLWPLLALSRAAAPFWRLGWGGA